MHLEVPSTSRPLHGDWSRLLVYVAGTAWDGVRGTDRHVAERMSATRPVLFVDPPVPVLRARLPEGAPRRRPARLTRPRLERVSAGLVRLSPVAPPGHTRAGMRRVAEQVLRRTVRAAVAALDTTTDVLVVAGLAPRLDILPARLRVLYGTDDFVAGARLMGLPRRRLLRQEQEQLRAAGLVVAVSADLADRWRSAAGDLAVVTNGCDVGHFSQAEYLPRPEEVWLTGPIAGMVGQLSERIDLDLLEAVADTGRSLLLVGPRVRVLADERFEALVARPNVQWVGPKSYEDLPRYVGAMAVGLVPYADTAFNRASSPLKVLEYLAAGRPAVVTDLPAMQGFSDEAVARAATPQAFARAVVAALDTPADRSAAARRRAEVAPHTWDARVAELRSLVEGRAAQASRRAGLSDV